MRELTKEQIEQVAGAGASQSYGSSYDPSHGHKHKHHHKPPHKHHSSYDPKPAPYAPPPSYGYTPTY